LDVLGSAFDFRNVVDDQELKEQVQKSRALLEGVSTDALRNMPLIRARVREGTAEVAAQMNLLAGNLVGRKFQFDADRLCQPAHQIRTMQNKRRNVRDEHARSSLCVPRYTLC
jgi:hypothetical protein